MVVIAILAGLILSIAGFAQKKAALSRASAEIQAISAACESYKADNGTYPHQLLAQSGTIPTTSGTAPSDILYPTKTGASLYAAGSVYVNASMELYEALTGDLYNDGFQTAAIAAGTRNYIADMKPDVWGRSNPNAAVFKTNPVLYLSDPFGNCYGYSTAQATAIASGSSTATNGYNPTFDLWCTAGNTASPYTATSGAQASGSAGDPMLQWVRNW